MPNICYAEIQVTGRKESIEEFERILNADYNYTTNEFSHKPHFWRIFDCYAMDMIHIEGLIYTQNFAIECAWSVDCCMGDGPFSYHETNNKDTDKERFDITLSEAARKLDLDIEIWSQEPGMCFTEHIHNRRGEELDNVCQDYNCTYLDYYDTYEEFCDDLKEIMESQEEYYGPFPTKEEFEIGKKEGKAIEKYEARNPFRFKANEPDGVYNPFASDFPKVMCEIVKPD